MKNSLIRKRLSQYIGGMISPGSKGKDEALAAVNKIAPASMGHDMRLRWVRVFLK